MFSEFVRSSGQPWGDSDGQNAGSSREVVFEDCLARLEDGVDRKIADGLKKGLSLIFNRIDQVIESKVNQKVEEHVKE